MKTAAQSFTLASIFALIIFGMSTSVFATGQDNIDHISQARYYENQAKEIRAKIDEQIKLLNHKSRSSYLGKHGRDVKKHVKYKIDKLGKAAEENLQKAAYHKKMAEEQAYRPSFAQSHKTKS